MSLLYGYFDRSNQQHAEAKTFGAAYSGMVGFNKSFSIGNLQNASELNATVVTRLTIPSEMTFYHWADFQGFFSENTETTRYVLPRFLITAPAPAFSFKPLAQFITVNQWDPLALAFSSTTGVALHETFRGVGPQIESVETVRKEGWGDFFGCKAV
nr:hypothetical protein [Desulforhabdus sp. TSK]